MSSSLHARDALALRWLSRGSAVPLARLDGSGDVDVSLIEMRENFVVAGDTNYYLPVLGVRGLRRRLAGDHERRRLGPQRVGPSAWTLAWAAGAKVRVEGQAGRRRR
jgi:hypothetical protein